MSKSSRTRKAFEIIVSGHGREARKYRVKPDRFAHFLLLGFAEPTAYLNPHTQQWERSKRVARRSAGVYWCVINNQLILSNLATLDTPSIRTNIQAVLSHWLYAHEGQIPKPTHWREFVKTIRQRFPANEYGNEAKRIIDAAHADLIEYWRSTAAVDRDPKAIHMDAFTTDRERQRVEAKQRERRACYYSAGKRAA